MDGLARECWHETDWDGARCREEVDDFEGRIGLAGERLLGTGNEGWREMVPEGGVYLCDIR